MQVDDQYVTQLINTLLNSVPEKKFTETLVTAMNSAQTLEAFTE
jgi:hypothetical protein